MEKNEIPVKYAPDGDGAKVYLVWIHMPNEQLKADKIGRIWHGRWIWNPRKTQPRVAQRHQGMVTDGRANILAQSRTEWRQFVKRVVDINGH